LASFSILAEAIVLEIGTNLGLVMLVEYSFASELLFGMREGTLHSFVCTIWLKGQKLRSYQYRHRWMN
jgi:hypothetical protein